MLTYHYNNGAVIQVPKGLASKEIISKIVFKKAQSKIILRSKGRF